MVKGSTLSLQILSRGNVVFPLEKALFVRSFDIFTCYTGWIVDKIGYLRSGRRKSRSLKLAPGFSINVNAIANSLGALDEISKILINAFKKYSLFLFWSLKTNFLLSTIEPIGS